MKTKYWVASVFAYFIYSTSVIATPAKFSGNNESNLNSKQSCELDVEQKNIFKFVKNGQYLIFTAGHPYYRNRALYLWQVGKHKPAEKISDNVMIDDDIKMSDNDDYFIYIEQANSASGQCNEPSTLKSHALVEHAQSNVLSVGTLTQTKFFVSADGLNVVYTEAATTYKRRVDGSDEPVDLNEANHYSWSFYGLSPKGDKFYFIAYEGLYVQDIELKKPPALLVDMMIDTSVFFLTDLYITPNADKFIYLSNNQLYVHSGYFASKSKLFSNPLYSSKMISFLKDGNEVLIKEYLDENEGSNKVRVYIKDLTNFKEVEIGIFNAKDIDITFITKDEKYALANLITDSGSWQLIKLSLDTTEAPEFISAPDTKAWVDKISNDEKYYTFEERGEYVYKYYMTQFDSTESKIRISRLVFMPDNINMIYATYFDDITNFYFSEIGQERKSSFWLSVKGWILPNVVSPDEKYFIFTSEEYDQRDPLKHIVFAKSIDTDDAAFSLTL